MISFDLGSHRFQLRAAAVFVWQDSVLLHRIEGDSSWSLPGGRVDPGEDAAKTVVREMREELDQSVVCGSLAYIVETFFADRGRPYHEIGLYFRASFAPDSRLLDTTRSHIGVEGHRRLEFMWFRLANLGEVDLHPSFLRQSLAEPKLTVQHVVQRD